MSPGRPSLYSDELADYICQELGNGRSLRSICENDDGMPDRSTVLRWQQNNDDFAAKCARTREGAQVEHVVDEMAVIEAGVLAGTIPPDAARVVLSSKQWRASKLAPKKYGDKVNLDATGGFKVTIGKEYKGL